MENNKRARGLYRAPTYDPTLTFACVTDGETCFEVDEGAYRIGPYLPTYDALPTKEEFEANGGVRPV